MAVVLSLGVLLVRFPHATWPEQLGLVVGLLGLSLLGHWWIGLIAWGVSRVAVMAARPFAQARRSAALQS
jgi:hypothetical protein